MDFTTSMDLLTPATEFPSAFSSVSSGTTAIILLFTVFFLMSGTILQIVAKWNIFDKADEPGWAAIVPFYGNYIFHYITWGNGWWFLASFIPGISFVVKVITMVKLSCSFDKNSVFTLGLMLYPPIFLAILGFDDSEYIG